MKRLATTCTLILLTSISPLTAQSEAGAIFLLISPGARAGGMGEAQVAVANDVYASYWNPAGLAFLEGSEMAIMHVNWLPNLADDLYYEFLAFRRHFPYLGTCLWTRLRKKFKRQIALNKELFYQMCPLSCIEIFFLI